MSSYLSVRALKPIGTLLLFYFLDDNAAFHAGIAGNHFDRLFNRFLDDVDADLLVAFLSHFHSAGGETYADKQLHHRERFLLRLLRGWHAEHLPLGLSSPSFRFRLLRRL